MLNHLGIDEKNNIIKDFKEVNVNIDQLDLISREKFEPEPGFELGIPVQVQKNFSLEIKFSKCTKTQTIRFIFTNNLI